MAQSTPFNMNDVKKYISNLTEGQARTWVGKANHAALQALVKGEGMRQARKIGVRVANEYAKNQWKAE